MPTLNLLVDDDIYKRVKYVQVARCKKTVTDKVTELANGIHTQK